MAIFLWSIQTFVMCGIESATAINKLLYVKCDMKHKLDILDVSLVTYAIQSIILHTCCTYSSKNLPRHAQHKHLKLAPDTKNKVGITFARKFLFSLNLITLKLLSAA